MLRALTGDKWDGRLTTSKCSPNYLRCFLRFDFTNFICYWSHQKSDYIKMGHLNIRVRKRPWFLNLQKAE
jgi:hypothetical protein